VKNKEMLNNLKGSKSIVGVGFSKFRSIIAFEGIFVF